MSNTGMNAIVKLLADVGDSEVSVSLNVQRGVCRFSVSKGNLYMGGKVTVNLLSSAATDLVAYLVGWRVREISKDSSCQEVG